MATVRRRGEKIRKFILNNVEAYPKDIVKMAAKKFKVTRQAINKHMQLLVSQNSITVQGTTRNREYSLHPEISQEFDFVIDGQLEEDVVWRRDISPLLASLPDNVLTIWSYCFTEIFNNAIDHSNGSSIHVFLQKTAVTTEIRILDDGEGIFKKIRRELGLLDERHAVLELSKGKVTTDPKHHTGEGIYFSSRVIEWFAILSGGTFFSHNKEDDIDWILENRPWNGTAVVMKMKNDAARTLKSVFDRHSGSGGDNYRFDKTVVPVTVAQYGEEMLISRSQAKRLLARLDKFKVVILDFKGVSAIGQAFADEIFRVFALKQSSTRIIPINMNEPVQEMVLRAL
jgi:hypothetical protein